MKNKIIITLLLLTTITFAQEKQWTLQECVAYALKNNITVKQTQLTVQTNKQDLVAAKGQFLPSLGANVSQSVSFGSAEIFPGNFVDRTFHSSNVGVSVSQNLFNGFRTLNLYKQAQLNMEASAIELNRIKDDISLNVVNSYLNILFNKENLNTANVQLDFSQKQFERVQKLVDAGVKPKGDLLELEATIANDEQRMVAAQNNLTLAKLGLAQLLQLPTDGFDVADVNVNLPSLDLLYTSGTNIYDKAVVERNEVKAAEKRIEIAKLNEKIARSGYLPNLSFRYGFSSGANFSNLNSSNSYFQQLNDNKGHNLSLNLNIPIFSRFQNKTSVAKNKIQQKNAQLNLDQVKLNLQSNIERAFTDAKAALKAYEAAKKSLIAQDLSVKNIQGKFSIGAANSFDLEQARNKLVNAKAAVTKAKYDFVFKTKVLDFYAGKSLFN